MEGETDMRTLSRLATTVVLLTLAAAPAFGTCVQNDRSQADLDQWNTHGGCWEEYFLWQYQAYDVRGSDWSDRGFFQACDGNLEYPKHWSSTTLLEYDLLDNNDQSFHGMVDYWQTARAAGSAFHDSLYHVATDDSTIFGGYDPNIHQVKTSCLLYDPSSPNANPGSRGGDFMHEGWHAWLQKYNFDNGPAGGHRACITNPDTTCTLGACTMNGCDYFYFHGISVYLFGAMWENDGTFNRFHSPNQVQVEYLCDVSDQSQGYIAASVRQSAAADANARAAQRFINGPGYTCGSPRPW
jgi:hypothetical protein